MSFNLEAFEAAFVEAFGTAIRNGKRARLGYIDENGASRLRVETADAPRPNMYYVREADGENPFVGMASNTGGDRGTPLPAQFLLQNMPIIIKEIARNDWHIVGLDSFAAAEFIADVALQPPDNPTRLETFLPGLLDQTEPASMRCRVMAAPYSLMGERKWFATQQTADFSASPTDVDGVTISLPTGDLTGRYILVQLDFASETLTYKQGDEFSRRYLASHTLAYKYDQNDSSSTLFPLPDAECFREGYVLLLKGMTAMKRGDHIWTMQDIFTAGDYPFGNPASIGRNISIAAGDNRALISPVTHSGTITINGTLRYL